MFDSISRLFKEPFTDNSTPVVGGCDGTKYRCCPDNTTAKNPTPLISTDDEKQLDSTTGFVQSVLSAERVVDSDDGDSVSEPLGDGGSVRGVLGDRGNVLEAGIGGNSGNMMKATAGGAVGGVVGGVAGGTVAGVATAGGVST